MGMMPVCDFCERPKVINNKLKVRGKRYRYLPNIVRPLVTTLELCDDCYKELVDTIKAKVTK
jgi:hypothetical protein